MLLWNYSILVHFVGLITLIDALRTYPTCIDKHRAYILYVMQLKATCR